MSRLTWRFTAFDSWFFRESRPFDVIGGSELGSVFPPSPATMAGAIRSAIGDFNNVVWSNYPQGYSKLQKQIGDSESLGQMAIKGIFLRRKNPDKDHWERLYPVPAHLVAIYEPPSTEFATHEKARIKALHFLQVGKPVRCDLGAKVCLAVAPKGIKGVKALEDYWLTQSGLSKVLNGKKDLIVKTAKIEDYDLIHSDELFTNEPRLGIARNNQSRTAEQGNLYQTLHIRPLDSIAIEVDVDGLDATEYPSPRITRLGGEGRAAAFEVFAENNNLIKTDDSKTDVLGVKLVLLSAVYVSQLNGYTPLPDFEKIEQDGKTIWRGKIGDIDLTLHCAVVGKVLREGGWDVRKSKPKPVQSLLPAGSVFYCKVTDGDSKGALKALQAAQLDNGNALDKALGRGLITAAPWFKHDSIEDGNPLMTITTAILGLLAQTSIHAGAGSQTGIIDLPIQREGHNNWPCVFGSAVKGALRDKAEQCVMAGLSADERPKDADSYAEKVQKDDAILSVYGAPPKQAGESAGAIIVTDARLLLFPVRSLTSQFKWVTCPDALRRYQADCQRLSLTVDFDISEFTSIGESLAIVHSESGTQALPASDKQSLPPGLFLEEYRFEIQPQDLGKVISALAQLMQRDDAKQALENQLVIVSNDSFAHLVNHATPVNAHNVLKPLSKISDNLWYEETLPPETLLYIGLSANASRQEKPAKENPPKTAEEILKQVLNLFITVPYLQLGGNETVGMGWCIVKSLESK